MSPKTIKNEGNKGKNNSGKSSKVTRPTQKAVISVAPPPEVPTKKFPVNTHTIGSRKWCLKDVLVFHPVVKKWYLKDNKKVQLPVEDRQSCPLKRNTIVDLLPQDISMLWSAVAYEETLYDYDVKNWVTTKLTGWVDDAYLDDYIEEFPNFEVAIPHATKSSTDLEQDITIEDEGYDEIRARYNMCGELCVAYIVKKDIDPKSSIDTVLATWKSESKKSAGKNKSSYENLVGKGVDNTLGPKQLKEILDLYNGGKVKKIIEPYVMDSVKIPLANSKDAYDDRHASDEFQGKLSKFYFITLVTINPNTGELIPNLDPTKRNHWVVVDKVSHNGVRVEIYNPSPNKRQAYSFREFSGSVGSNPNTGWWVQRKRSVKADKPAPEKFEVKIDHATADLNDAEQYMLVENLKKTNLCGEFSVSYILMDSLGFVLERWHDNQEILKKRSRQTAGVWELATVLQAYGFNNMEGIAGGTQSFSIDKVLQYWKMVQPDLYNSILGSGNNKPTGMDDLLTILKAYGYNNKGDYGVGGLESSPGRSAAKLNMYYLIAGVKIDTGKKGRLKNKLGDGVDHWVVVTEINPVGTMVGGNGGWVKLYNPYSNVIEEYSYKEFMESFSGAGLWIMRDITPLFIRQYRAPAKDKRKGSDKKTKTNVSKVSQADLLKAIQSKGDKTSLQAFAKTLSNKSGWSKQDIVKLMKTPEKINRKSIAEITRDVCESLGVDLIPHEIGKWLRDTSNGDSSFAIELASVLCEFGILIVDGKKAKVVDLEAPNLSRFPQTSIIGRIDHSSVPHLAHTVVTIFTDRVIDQLKKIPPTIQAYKSLAEYVEWQKAIDVPGSNIYRVRRWGDPEMTRYGFDTNKIPTGNFQAVGLYNAGTGFGAVTNYIRIQRDDIDQLIDMQFDEIVDGKKMTVENKMNWLCQLRGRIYMFDSGKDSWQGSSQIRWGTLALGGNLVQVVEKKEMNVKIPGEEKASQHWMARLAGFRKSDWSRSLDELLALGLIHRCFVANDGNVFADTPRGIVYSPFYSPLDWDFAGTDKPDALWIPFDYLEDKVESKP